MPKVTGKPLAAAKVAIAHAGCTVGKIRGAHSATVKKGSVISQQPKAAPPVVPVAATAYAETLLIG